MSAQQLSNIQPQVSEFRTIEHQSLPLSDQLSNQPDKQIKIYNQQCLFHSNNFITNICLNQLCLLPLCPSCIPMHLRDHQYRKTQPSIEAIEETRMRTIQNLSEQVKQITKIKEEVDTYQKGFDEQIQNHQVQLENSKKKILITIDAFFQTLEKDIKAIHEQFQQKRIVQLNNAVTYSRAKFEDLNNNLSKLQGPKYLKTLIKLNTNEYQQSSQLYLKECIAHLKVLEYNELKIQEDEKQIYQIHIALSNYVKIVNSLQIENLKERLLINISHNFFQEIIIILMNISSIRIK